MRRKGLLLALVAIAAVSGFISRHLVRSAVPPETAPSTNIVEEASPAETDSSTANPETAPQITDPQFDAPSDQEIANTPDASPTDPSLVEPSFVEPAASQPERLRLHIADAPAENPEPDVATANQDDIADTNPDILASTSPTSTANSSFDIAADSNSDAPADTNPDTPEVPLTSGVGSAELVARWQDLTRATTLLLLGTIILLAAARWLFSGARK